ncbi:extracellular metallo proteinase MEP [Dothidotthia symphoricarpi CBS 119687]|uniref:Extracellular metalloproteinase n=1 Tax=Dothidotthia symphoricarpi CBS 119687 TaxID=1392245 RepID=A0A6A6ADP8_9PLEO|nr:extracellular metallo proteinase MEP [Dothidotthia symphoricarpi CBS 119687]KAF2129686.1 extracellular metallo proteinase MEP [Dothidotthia symphoricarpi CBS 119687]
MRSALLATLASLATIKGVHAHPASQVSRTLSRRGVDLDAFRMVVKTEYKNATEVDLDPTIPTLRARATAEETATELVQTTAPGATFRLVNDHYVGTNGVAHYYFKQTANGLDIDNADFNVNIGRNGKVFSFGNSFFKGDIPSLPTVGKRDTTDPADALKSAVNILQLPISAGSATAEPKAEADTFAIKQTTGSLNEPEARLVYVQAADGSLKLTWRIETDIASNWLLTYVDATSGKEVHAVVDYAADDSYQVYPWGINDPTEGQRVYVEDPFDSSASEFGWNSDGTDWFKTTRGNNAAAQTNWENKQTDLLSLPRPVARDLKFHYPYSLNETDYHKYANASVTQLFYTGNTYHDLLHTLGFNEQAGNFEINNNGGGGVGNDFVYLNAQDGSGVNNANFATPPDGQAARMRMYIWTSTVPVRDCSFEAGVVIHEYTHGLSNRLTGGPKNSGCLSMLESGGMGEGWSDFYATAIRLKKSDTRKTDYALGAWVSGNPAGIRNYLYSTSMTTNPQTYQSVELYSRVHPIGGIWASMLYEVLWNLIDKHGKNDGPKPDFDENDVPTDGRYLAMKIVMDGMSLQPCNPNFVQARDAIIDADWLLTGGANACPLWTAFAKRGLGEGARYQVTGRLDSFKIPNDAC